MAGERLSSITQFRPPSIHEGISKPAFTWKGAQYSPRFIAVNRLLKIISFGLSHRDKPAAANWPAPGTQVR
jgi:hypothetical protein